MTKTQAREAYLAAFEAEVQAERKLEMARTATAVAAFYFQLSMGECSACPGKPRIAPHGCAECLK
jgi:hypothetical protein